MFSLCHPWFRTTNLSYTFPILETSATASCGSTGIICKVHIFFKSGNHSIKLLRFKQITHGIIFQLPAGIFAKLLRDVSTSKRTKAGSLIPARLKETNCAGKVAENSKPWLNIILPASECSYLKHVFVYFWITLHTLKGYHKKNNDISCPSLPKCFSHPHPHHQHHHHHHHHNAYSNK